MQHDEPKDIAEGVIACGSKLVEKGPQLHVVITGILPRDQFPSERRNRIQQTNYMLKSKCWTKGFKYIEPSSQWVSATGELESGLYFKDHLHLIRPGNNILAMQMASIVSVALSKSPKIRTPLQHNHDVVTVQALPCLEIIPCTYKSTNLLIHLVFRGNYSRVVCINLSQHIIKKNKTVISPKSFSILLFKIILFTTHTREFFVE